MSDLLDQMSDLPCIECECDRRELTLEERQALASQFTGMLAAMATERASDSKDNENPQ